MVSLISNFYIATICNKCVVIRGPKPDDWESCSPLISYSRILLPREVGNLKKKIRVFLIIIQIIMIKIWRTNLAVSSLSNSLEVFPYLQACLSYYITYTNHLYSFSRVFLNKFEVLAPVKVIYQNNFTREGTFYRKYGRPWVLND